jgi:hypothetical protein
MDQWIMGTNTILGNDVICCCSYLITIHAQWQARLVIIVTCQLNDCTYLILYLPTEDVLF